MAFRESRSEKLYYSGYYEYNSKNGIETYKNNSEIEIKSYYPDPPEILTPTEYTIITFDFYSVLKNSEYKEKYFTNTSPSVNYYIKSYSPRKVDDDNWYINLCAYSIGTEIENAIYTLSRQSIVYNTSSEDNYLLYHQNRNLISNNKKKYIGARLNKILMGSPDFDYTGYATIQIIGINVSENSPYTVVSWLRCDPEINNILPESGSTVD